MPIGIMASARDSSSRRWSQVRAAGEDWGRRTDSAFSAAAAPAYLTVHTVDLTDVNDQDLHGRAMVDAPNEHALNEALEWIRTLSGVRPERA
jgi:hypothetical protein